MLLLLLLLGSREGKSTQALPVPHKGSEVCFSKTLSSSTTNSDNKEENSEENITTSKRSYATRKS
uniref:Putative ovule protein n=1 Tax=Solanum chacoense TaxID=4108 RepID=A0A0V0GYM9_SOLCH